MACANAALPNSANPTCAAPFVGGLTGIGPPATSPAPEAALSAVAPTSETGSLPSASPTPGIVTGAVAAGRGGGGGGGGGPPAEVEDAAAPAPAPAAATLWSQCHSSV